MPVQTSSQIRQLSSNSATFVNKHNNTIKIKYNAKGHPTVGHITLKRQPRVNPHLDKCDTLQNTSQSLVRLI